MKKILELMKKYGIDAVVIAGILYCAIMLLTSCQVTRNITTTSSSVQKGDTTTIIQTKTIEQYTATKKTNN